MVRTLYVTSLVPHSGKSLVSLGLMELLSARVARVGFFRPIVGAADGDPSLELVRSRYDAGGSGRVRHALTEAEASALPYEEVRRRVLEAYKRLEEDCDFVLCEGSDLTGGTPALAFGRNADLANELGAPVLVVVTAGSADEAEAGVAAARGSLTHKGCDVFGVVVNRVPADRVEAVAERLSAAAGDEPVFVLAEHAELGRPTVADVAGALGAKLLSTPADGLHRQVRELRVGAMSVEHFLEQLVPGALVIVPADRPDVLVACLASALSPTLPTVAGVLVTGGYPVAESVRALVEAAPFPVLSLPTLTHVAAVEASAVRPALPPGDERRIATALGVFDAGVDAAEVERRLALDRPARLTPLMFEYELVERARRVSARIVLPEGADDRVLRAADIVLRRGVAALTILGDPHAIRARASALDLELAEAELVDPATSELRERYAARYHELRRHKGVTEDAAYDAVASPNYFATLLVEDGAVEGMVSGAAHTTAETIRPAFEIIRAREGISVVSSVFFMCLADRVLVYGDCAVNPKPAPAELADIAISSAETADAFGIAPRIAMLSYSTGESGRGADVEAVREATAILRERRPALRVEGPIQYDAAVDPDVASVKLPDSEVAGRATVFVFPDLDTGNVAYKAVQRSANAIAIGPVLQGLRRPVNDLSRGARVPDIVNTIAITAIQAEAGRA
ncbi:MAG: phosphate acetyltransferase [Thermoleophilia bacterium]|nr:phosphate acetyltransferase [Thermoleophilia bacterium]